MIFMVRSKAAYNPILPVLVKRGRGPSGIGLVAASPCQVNHGKGRQGIVGDKQYLVAIGPPGDRNYRKPMENMLAAQFPLKFGDQLIATAVKALPGRQPFQFWRGLGNHDLFHTICNSISPIDLVARLQFSAGEVFPASLVEPDALLDAGTGGLMTPLASVSSGEFGTRPAVKPWADAARSSGISIASPRAAGQLCEPYQSDARVRGLGETLTSDSFKQDRFVAG